MVLTKPSDIKAWEHDLDTSYTAEQWQKALHTTYAATKSVNLWELTHKILLHWYLTSFGMSKFDAWTSPLCWRKCGTKGMLHHILWSCPAIHAFWTKIFQLMAQILELQIPLTAGMAILSLGIESIPGPSIVIVIHVLLSARLSIMRHWRDHVVPTLSEVIKTTNTHATYEIMFAAVQGNYQAMSSRWKLWTEWYKVRSDKYQS